MKTLVGCLIAMVLGGFLGSKSARQTGNAPTPAYEKTPGTTHSGVSPIEDPTSWRTWSKRIAAKTTTDDLIELALEFETAALGSETESIGRMLAARWTEIDPRGAWEFLNQQEKEGLGTAQQRLLRQWLVTEWARLDLEQLGMPQFQLNLVRRGVRKALDFSLGN